MSDPTTPPTPPGNQDGKTEGKQDGKQPRKYLAIPPGRQPTQGPSDLALQDALDAALTRLKGEGGNPTRLRKEVESALAPGRRRAVPTLAEIQAVHDDLAECTSAVAELLAAAVRAEDRAAAAAPFEADWLSQTDRLLRGALARDASQWRALWLSRWSEALSSSAWEAAATVAALAQQPHAGQLQRPMAALGEALNQDEPDAAAALAAATQLAQWVRDPFDVHLTLVVLAARCSIQLHDVPAALTYAEQSVAPLGTTPRLSNLSLAVRAEAQLAAGNVDAAAQLAHRARSGKGAGCDALVVSGLVAEVQAQTPTSPYEVMLESAPDAPDASDASAASDASSARSGGSSDHHQAALDYYDLAALRFGDEAVHGHLLQPVPPALVWRVGRRLRVTQPARALELYNRALDQQMVEAAEKRARVERAALLKESGRGPEATADLRRAAELYLSSRSDTAISLLHEACELGPEEAANHWELAEALRVTIDRGRPRQARRRAQEADEQFARGFRLQPEPGVANAWVLLSWASLRWMVRSASVDECAVDMERALLLDGGSQRSLAFLVALLRDSGTPRAAWEAVPSMARSLVTDVALAEQLAVTCMDLGDYEQALELLDDFELFQPATPTTVLVRIVALLLSGEPARALEVLEDPGSFDGRTLLVAALCHARLEQEEAYEQVLRAVVANPGDDSTTRPWAEFLLGEVTGPIEAYEVVLAEKTSWLRDPVVPLDLAQMLVVRGAEEDLSRARALFREGVTSDVGASSLAVLADLELPALRDRVAETPHATVAGEIIDEASAAATEQISRLRSATMPQGTAARLCRARVATHEGRLEEALDGYAAVPAEEVGEVVLGMRAAAERLLAQGDDAVAADDTEGAEPAYRALAAHAGTLGGELERSVAARLALLDEERADSELRGQAVADLAVSDGDTWALDGALTVFARNPLSLWQHHDVLEKAAARAPESSSALLALAERLPLSRAYRTGVEAFDTFAAPQPYSVEVLLPPTDHGLLEEGSDLRTGIPLMREVVMEELGVRIPGLRVHQQPEMPEDEAWILVFGDLATAVELGAGPPGPPILDALSVVVRDNVFRWVSPDDIPLWASGWDVDTPYEAARPDMPPRSTHIRLARLLRRLLREGVPITDRDTILATYAAAVREGASDLATLTAVRRALYPATLPVGPDGEYAEPVALPDELTEQLSAWRREQDVAIVEPPRAAKVAVRKQLLGWLDELGPAPLPAVRVADASTRLDLARLLGDLRPRVHVVIGEELP